MKQLSEPLDFYEIDCIEAYINHLESQEEPIDDPNMLNMAKIKTFAEENEAMIKKTKEEKVEDI